MANLLAPCNQCDTIPDKEIGYVKGPHITLFKTFNGSSRYVYQVGGKNVTALLIESLNGQTGWLKGLDAHPDYPANEFFRVLYMVASKDYNHIRLDKSLENNHFTPDLIDAIRRI